MSSKYDTIPAVSCDFCEGEDGPAVARVQDGRFTQYACYYCGEERYDAAKWQSRITFLRPDHAPDTLPECAVEGCGNPATVLVDVHGPVDDSPLVYACDDHAADFRDEDYRNPTRRLVRFYGV